MKTFTEIEFWLESLDRMNSLITIGGGSPQTEQKVYGEISRITHKINTFPGSWVNAVRIIIQLRNQK